MNRKFSLLLASIVVLFPALAGCQKSADQQSADQSPANDSSATPTSSASKASKATAPAPKPMVIPADTAINVVIDEPLSSKTASPGQRFSATVESPIEVDGKVVIPKGAHATGVVKDAKAAGRFKGGAALELGLISVNVDGKDYEVQASAPTLTHKGKGKRTAAMAGGGAAGGALIGGLAGGGKGALIGGLIGAAAGTGGAAFTGKADVVVPVESGLSFKLLQPLEIRRK